MEMPRAMVNDGHLRQQEPKHISAAASVSSEHNEKTWVDLRLNDCGVCFAVCLTM
jgi:hypothetical protein